MTELLFPAHLAVVGSLAFYADPNRSQVFGPARPAAAGGRSLTLRLRSRPRVQQQAEQHSHAVRVVEAGVGGGIAVQRGQLSNAALPDPSSGKKMEGLLSAN